MQAKYTFYLDAVLTSGLLLFLAWQSATTWRKWPDLIIDYGRELYVPWQVANGAVLYHDIVHYYGPLGISLNAALFRIFGAGFDTLFFASLILLAVFTVSLQLLLTRLTDRLTATLASLLFLSAFAFGNYVGIGNYNFVSPYSHDTVYGIYLCVVLLATLWAWLSSERLAWMIPAGLAFGGTYLTKPEITIAALAISVLAALANGWLILTSTDILRPPANRISRLLPALRAWLLWLVWALMPVLAFNLWFAARIPGPDGWRSIHSGWTAIFGNRTLRGSLTNLTFMGMDHPGENLTRVLSSSACGLLAIAILAALDWAGGRLRKTSPAAATACIVALFAFTAWLLFTLSRDFLQVGHILIGTSSLLLIQRSVRFMRSTGSRPERAQLAAQALWSAFGAAMLLKMLLNPRIEHYGFFQAMPATLDLVMFLVHELPRLQGRFGGAKKPCRISGIILILTLSIGLCARSHKIWNCKTMTVGSGHNTLKTFSENINPMGSIVETVRKDILLNHADARTLTVFPEGVSLNFLFRLKNPVALYEFAPPALAFYGQDRLLAELERTPPDLIILISRDISEFGSPAFGWDEISGRRLLGWMQTHYSIATRIGDNPLQPDQAGAILLARKK